MTERIFVRGNGIVGQFMTHRLARAGLPVAQSIPPSTPPVGQGPHRASALAAGMISPRCEWERGPAHCIEAGLKSLDLWEDTLHALRSSPGDPLCYFKRTGTWVVAHPGDTQELQRFLGFFDPSHYQWVKDDHLKTEEPDLVLGGGFKQAAWIPHEGCVDAQHALELLEQANAHLQSTPRTHDIILDCTGLGAAPQLKGLRGVRGEIAVIRSAEVKLSRPVRVVHPRYPLYIVPRGDDRYFVGATVIESESNARVTVRSSLELMSALYAVNKAFGESEICNFYAGVRPAFSHHEPRIIRTKNGWAINGMYRNGYLFAPVFAEAMACYFSQASFPKFMNNFIDEERHF